MPKYTYVLSSQSGVRTEGSIFASNPEAAEQKLQRQNKIIISIVEDKKARMYFWQKPHLSFQNKMMFTKHLATMVKAGIPITEVLQILVDQTRRATNRKMYQDILEMVQSGQSLSNSLKAYGYIFSEVFVNMIATGEKSGTLEETLHYLDIQLEKEYELRKKLVSAFIYPAVIMGITLLMSLGIVIFVMPRIIRIFESFDFELPLVTRVLIGFSTFVTENPLLAIVLSIGIVGFFITLFRLKILKSFWQRVAMRLPVFGNLVIYSNLVQFSRMMHSLLKSGMPVTKSLDITANMIDNVYYEKMIREAHDKVEQGGKLGESFENNERLFPLLVSKMLFIGEKTGSLESSAEHIAELYEQRVDSLTRNLSVLLEPLLLVFMGILVGGVAIAIILPIYQLPNLIQR